MKHEKGTDEEANSFDDQLDTPDEVEDSSNEDVESTDEEEDTSDEDYELELKKKSNFKGSKAKSDRSKLKIISYKEIWENTYWKRKSPFYFSRDEESGDADIKWVNDKAKSSQATPKSQSSQAKALRSNVIVGIASQYKNLATISVEKKLETRTAAEGARAREKEGLEVDVISCCKCVFIRNQLKDLFIINLVPLKDYRSSSYASSPHGYESEKYFDAEDAAGTNHSDRKLVKRGITRLYKFRMEYGKPGGIKIKVTFDALNRVSGLHRALFLTFLGDLVREHIGLKILSWKKVDKESRDKPWDEITIKNKEIEADEEPSCGIIWFQGRGRHGGI
nr:hypothetical protein [Tanacetum cinerariifolium]